MNYEKNSRKALFALTLLTVISIASIIAVYAVWIGTFTGLEVTVTGSQSSIVTYAETNEEPGDWNVTLAPTASWYTRLEVNAGAYSGPVTVTWQLEQKSGPSTWTPVGSSIQTDVVLSGGAEYVYASSLGGLTGNFDWTSTGYAEGPGTYHVIATVDSA